MDKNKHPLDEKFEQARNLARARLSRRNDNEPHQGKRQRERVRLRLLRGKMNPKEIGVIQATEEIIREYHLGVVRIEK